MLKSRQNNMVVVCIVLHKKNTEAYLSTLILLFFYQSFILWFNCLTLYLDIEHKTGSADIEGLVGGTVSLGSVLQQQDPGPDHRKGACSLAALNISQADY